jgi:hypothetical protein
LKKERRSIEQAWREMSEAARKEAQKLPHGRERDNLIREARRLETASQINEWLASPELTPPK